MFSHRLSHVAFAIGILFFLTGASEPEIVRVRVPAQDVSRIFPAGTELRVMTAAEFEAKVADALKGLASSPVDRAPRLIRARHHASVRSGVLTGTTELIIEPARAGPAEYVLEPWTPAIVPTPGILNVVGARSDGKPTLWIDRRANQTIQLEWELAARPYSRGRGFVLRLPGGETGTLTLEIPKGWEPVSRRGIRRGPLATPDLSRNLWEIDAELGRIDLHIYDPGGSDAAAPGPVSWLTSATEVDLRGAKDHAPEVANWRTVWQISLDPRNTRRLGIELDEGLDLINVAGASVEGYRVLKQGSGSRVEVALEPGGNSSAELRILAHAEVPPQGAWTIPAARPSGAVWTGGTTTVLLDDDLVLRECREKSGRRVFPTGGDAGLGRRLVFELESPGPAAELVFAEPRAESSCEVRGQLYLGGSPSRLECRLNWKIQQGLLPEMQIDLSPNWLPDQVRFREFPDPTTWRSLPLPSGLTRIRVAVPPAAIARKELTVDLVANSTIPGGRGPLELPRVRPVGTRIVDEAWLAWVDNDTMIRPGQGRGLAWIDPADVVGPPAQAVSIPEMREALAWRWIKSEAGATIDRQRVDQEPTAVVTARARIDTSGHQLLLDGRIVIDARGQSLDAVPVWVKEPDDPLKTWRFLGEAAGPLLETRSIDDATVARMGLPRGGSARNVLIDIRPGTRKAIFFHAQVPWKSQGPVPLLFLPQGYWSRGVIEIEVPPWLRSRLEPTGLRRLEPAVIAQNEERAGTNQGLHTQNERVPGRNSDVQSFTYTKPTSQLELATQWPRQSPLKGTIQEAVLTTTARLGARSFNRLRLLVRAGEARSLRIEPPGSLSIVRLRRDGSDIAPIREKSGLSIPLENTSAGSRVSTIVLDYEVDSKAGTDGALLRPALPQVDMPCLSFIWEIITPSGWEPAEWSGGLDAADPLEQSSWPFAALRIWRPWGLPTFGRRGRDDQSLYQELDARLVGSTTDAMSFGEWFTRWDSGLRPVVVDRLSLNLAGFGPKSPCLLGAVANQDRSDISLATLRRTGLALVPFHDVLVITTEEKAPEFEQSDRLSAAVVETLIWGSDHTDRLQTVARFRGEPSPRSSTAGGQAMTERSRLVPSWSSWRFSSSDWPSGTASVRVVDTRSRAVSAWLVAGILFVSYVLLRAWQVGWRGLLVFCCVAGGALLAGLSPARFEAHASAAVIAGLAAILLEMSALRPTRSPVRQTAGQGSEVVLASRVALSITGGLIVGLCASSLSAAHAWGSIDRESAILALFPDDGPAFDPNKPHQNVILRLSDFKRLERLSREASRREPEPPSVRAVSALHRVVRENARNVVIESEYELVVLGRSPGSWEVPVASTRDIEVTLDGKPQAIAIEPGGASAILELPPSSRHVLRLRRTASARTEANGNVLRVPIIAMPLARVIVEPARDGAGTGELASWGSIERRSGGTLVGHVGPASRIEIRWPNAQAAGALRESGDVQGLVLWDIHPAGDRVRARYRIAQVRDGAALRIRHDPNLVLRSAEVSGLIDGFWVESPSRDEWTLHAEPSIGTGSTISIDCWMPISAPAEKRAASAIARVGVAPRTRRIPRLQPLDVERFSGLIGIRRPGDWTGRLDPSPLADPVGDEAFVTAWGSLSGEPLTLCGTGRFAGECAVSLRTGPNLSRIQVKPTVQLNIEPGKVAVAVDAEVTELAGHLLYLDISLPDDFRIVEVSGEALTSWSMRSKRQLQLMFDSPVSRPKRLVRIMGWIPVSDDSSEAGLRKYRLATPWIGGEGIEFATGFLTISSASKASLLGATGLTLISSESSPPVGSIPPRYRYSYQVDDPQKLGAIAWDSPAPTVSVAIESQLTVYSDSAEWTAALRYDVSGKAMDAIHLRIPAAWSDAAEIHASGGECRVSQEPLGASSLWTITPKHPMLGSERFVLKSTLPLTTDRAVMFPELAPLGWGAVDAYLGVVNATGRSVSIGKSTGLQAIPDASKFRSADFTTVAGTRLAAYRVMSKDWTLQVQLARNESQVETQEQARVGLANVSVAISADGSATGRAAYDVYGGGGRALSLELPPGATLLGATVDANPAQPFWESARRCSINLENRHASNVCVIWRTPPASPQAKNRRVPLELPRAGIGQSPALVAVHLAPGIIIDGDVGGLELAAPSRSALARAERFGRVISDLASRFDRSSGRDHEKLVSLLINQELALRDAERSIRWSAPSREKSSSGRGEREAALIESARSDRLEIVRRAGLGDDLASAEAYLGQSTKALDHAVMGVPELSAFDRIRSPGDCTTFVGVLAGVEGTPARSAILIESPNRAGIWRYPRAGGALLIVVLLGMSLLTVVFRRRAWIDAIGLILVSTVASYCGGPLVFVGGLGLTAAGWWASRGEPLTRTAP